MEQINRRTFIKGVGLTAGLLGAVGLAGCGASPSLSDTDGSTRSESDDAQNYPIEETLTYDIVVVGGGISGLSAAVEGAQQGARVILIEKQATIGGNSLGAEGPFAVDSPLQKEANVDLTLYEALKNELQFSNYRSNSQIWINYLRQSGDNISWLLENGVKFVDVRPCNAGLQGWHYYDGGGTAAVAAMEQAALSAGVEIMTSTPMVDLISEDDVVTGVIAEQDGAYLAIKGSGVVLASGGTGANVETLSDRTGFDCSNATINCNPGNTGDGLDVAIELGAATRPACIMGDKCVYGFGMFDHISFATTRQPILWVNGHGERFVDEGIVCEDIPSAFNAIFLGQESCYALMDQSTVDAFAQGAAPDSFANYMPDQGAQLPQLQQQIDGAVEGMFGNVFKGETVEALAIAMDFDPNTLEDTIDRYNQWCDKGSDEDFFKKAEYLIPLKTGPFYGFKMDPLVVCAIGGLCTDTQNRVLNDEGDPIPGLYAVGLDGCNLYEETYNMYLGGSANGYCIYSGRNAARSILEA
ncbi:FAD-dependent oxidoreductase [Adlercreutzia sp. R7]|uniref:FAD-dependent oxidoreductase n=1 Tax=Adlercreutzia wanghongyangiae TaxID=3111451 RepID=A0ABU6IFH3_9ACTN|nr:FAD-dependent oxidoreductase [Adlercreutzia sp. R7]